MNPQKHDKNMSLMRGGVARFGFTLAEVLVTLGVVGVVAAMTLSSLITTFQKLQTEARLKQAYSLLYNAIRLSEDQNGFIQLPDDATANDLLQHDKCSIFKDRIAPYFAGATRVTGKRNTWTLYNSANVSLGKSLALASNGSHCFNNGMCFFMVNYGKLYWYILVDLNGSTKPNRVGRDIFYFALHQTNNGLVMDGLVYGISEKTTTDKLYNSCNNTSGDWSNGKSCTEIIMRNAWKIPKDPRYPW